MPLLGEQTVMLTVARIDQNRIRVNVIPTRKREEDENAAFVHAIQLQRHTRRSGRRNGEESLGGRRGKSAAPTHVGGGEGRDGRSGEDRT